MRRYNGRWPGWARNERAVRKHFDAAAVRGALFGEDLLQTLVAAITTRHRRRRIKTLFTGPHSKK